MGAVKTNNKDGHKVFAQAAKKWNREHQELRQKCNRCGMKEYLKQLDHDIIYGTSNIKPVGIFGSLEREGMS